MRVEREPPPPDDECTAIGSQGVHCCHWWDGEQCCMCGAPAMTEAEQRAQGMIE